MGRNQPSLKMTRLLPIASGTRWSRTGIQVWSHLRSPMLSTVGRTKMRWTSQVSSTWLIKASRVVKPHLDAACTIGKCPTWKCTIRKDGVNNSLTMCHYLWTWTASTSWFWSSRSATFGSLVWRFSMWRLETRQWLRIWTRLRVLGPNYSLLITSWMSRWRMASLPLMVRQLRVESRTGSYRSNSKKVKLTIPKSMPFSSSRVAMRTHTRALIWLIDKP